MHQGGKCFPVQRRTLSSSAVVQKEALLMSDVSRSMQNRCSINPSCQYLASYAQDIVDRCPSNKFENYLAGQEFDTDNYNMIVSAQNC